MTTLHDITETDNGEADEHLRHMGWSAFFRDQLDNREREHVPARVIGVRKNSFLVSQGKGEVLATLAGGLLHDPAALYPAVGDWILLRDSIITAVLSRKNALSRRAAGARGRKNETGSGHDQIIATNLDTVFIVCGLDRDFNLRRIERYLTLVYNCGINPAIILTKADLHHNPGGCADAVAAVAFDLPIYLVSADHEESLSRIRTHVHPGHTAALIGSSGAGKSTVINRLYGAEIRSTNSVSRRVGKGQHTTTNRDLILLPSGGMLIDNPGIREIALGIGIDSTTSAFPDIEALALLCRFPDCSHNHEPGCKVLEAVAADKLSEARLRSYHKIQSELDYFSQLEKKGAARVEKERRKGIAQKSKEIQKRRKQW